MHRAIHADSPCVFAICRVPTWTDVGGRYRAALGAALLRLIVPPPARTSHTHPREPRTTAGITRRPRRARPVLSGARMQAHLGRRIGPGLGLGLGLTAALALAACGSSASSSSSGSDGGSPGLDGGSDVTVDAGSWTAVTPSAPVGELYDIWGSAPNDAWITADGGLLHWDGTTWTALPATMTGLLGPIFARVHGTAKDDVWLAGLSPGPQTFTVAFSHYDGTAWSAPTDGGLGFGEIYGLWATAKNDVWAVGKDEGSPVRGIVLHYDGASWKHVHDDPRVDIFAGVWASGTNDVWVSGANLVTHYDGSAWSDVDLGSAAMARYGEIVGSSPHDLWLTGVDDGGGNGAIAHYDGSAWSKPVGPNSGSSYGGMWIDAAGSLWVAGGVSTSSSTTGVIDVEASGAWGTATLPPTTPQLDDVWGSPAGGGLWVIGQGVILHRE